MPFGGGGALHAGALIREVGLKAAIAPRFPGLTSALGCVIADLRHDRVQTVNLMLDGLDAAALDRRLVERGRARSRRSSRARASRSSASTSFRTRHALSSARPTRSRRRCRSPSRAPWASTAASVLAAFEASYEAQFQPQASGRADQDRFAARDGDRPPPAFRSLGAGAGPRRKSARRRGAAREKSGSAARGWKRRSGRGSICRSAPSSRARRSSSSLTRRSSSIPA